MPTDAQLIQIVDDALADATRRSGQWLACKPGCHQCCIGVFPITPLDADRLRTALQQTDPALAQRIRTRVAASLERIAHDFPGDQATGLLPLDPDEIFEEAFEDFANDEPCPVLDPATGTCDLYAARPLPCRTFGPPVMNAEGGLAVCELCFIDAPPETIAACEMIPDPGHLEEQLLSGLDDQRSTIIAYALRGL